MSSVKNQIRANFEVIYVIEGNSSLDQLVRSIANKLGVPIQICRNDGKPGLSEARNIGAEKANGQILAFVDDDVVLAKDWTDAVERAFESYPHAVGVTGPALPLWEDEKLDWLPRQLDWLIGCTRWFDSDSIVQVRNCWGMNMAFRRLNFIEVGGFSVRSGFHRGPMAEDVELSLRIKKGARLFKTLFVPGMTVQHKVHSYRVSVRFIVERSQWIGRSRRGILESTEPEASLQSFEMSILRSLLSNAFTDLFKPGPFPFSKYFKRTMTIALSGESFLLGYVLGPKSDFAQEIPSAK